MSLEMISAKTIVNWVPNGRQYEYEFFGVSETSKKPPNGLDMNTVSRLGYIVFYHSTA